MRGFGCLVIRLSSRRIIHAGQLNAVPVLSLANLPLARGHDSLCESGDVPRDEQSHCRKQRTQVFGNCWPALFNRPHASHPFLDEAARTSESQFKVGSRFVRFILARKQTIQGLFDSFGNKLVKEFDTSLRWV